MCETLKNTFFDTRIRERHRGRGRGRCRVASVKGLAGMYRKMTGCALTSNLPTYNAYVHFLVLLLHLRVRLENDKAVSPDRLPIVLASSWHTHIFYMCQILPKLDAVGLKDETETKVDDLFRRQVCLALDWVCCVPDLKRNGNNLIFD